MTAELIDGKSLGQWTTALPALEQVIQGQELFWVNPGLSCCGAAQGLSGLDPEDILAAEQRLERFAPYLAAAFPDTRENRGIIESPLKAVPGLGAALAGGKAVNRSLWLKLDSHLPVSGSVKARGGIYEVLKHAETLALDQGLITRDADYTALGRPDARAFFAGHAIAVGSTGNLGLSIGIMGATLGFRVTVHMSMDAKQWKKALLRRRA